MSVPSGTCEKCRMTLWISPNQGRPEVRGARRCHPVEGQRSQAQFGVAEGAGYHTPRPVGFLRPADPYFYRVCGRAGAIERTLGLCTEFSLY
jgi:hypothetical protein